MGHCQLVAAEAYVDAVNRHNLRLLLALFTPESVVEDGGRVFTGLDEIRVWAESEVIKPRVTLTVLESAQVEDEIILTTEVDGDFDRTGLPARVVITHGITLDGGRIGRLTCRLVPEPGEPSAT